MFPVLQKRRKQQAKTHTGGEQQMLAIGRALMSSPKMLILDEPSLGLAPIIVKTIFRCIKEISLTGTTILIVEQNALQTLKIADYAIVLELGKISIEGAAQDLINDQRLIDAYLGNKKQG
jgi:branched-chain amino acid transport system ATP-binding protein